MKQITFELTEAEYHALETMHVDPLELIRNFAQDRARRRIEELARDIIQKRLQTGESISGTKEEMFLAEGYPALKDMQTNTDKASIDSGS